jgi:hypothetical protein
MNDVHFQVDDAGRRFQSLHPNQLVPVLSVPRRASQLLSFFIIFALGAIGFAVQYSMFKDRRTYSRTSPAKPA